MIIIKCIAKNDGTVFYYTRVKGRHDITFYKTNAHGFATTAEAQRMIELMGTSIMFFGLRMELEYNLRTLSKRTETPK